jgi:hypothetical protein
MTFVETRAFRDITVIALATALAACTPAAEPLPAGPTPTALGQAPWRAARLDASQVPAVYTSVWRQAANRNRCALLAPVQLDPAVAADVTPRPATFSGGWAVAYDLPDVRSAFGVAGSGSSAWEDGIYDAWPHKRVYADSSRVGYGLEGGAGPNWLAYVRIPGQDCLYNVWSRRGRTHLEELLDQLRFVSVR